MKLAFLGLGTMGFPMAGHLAQKSTCNVAVYNRTASKAAAWYEKYGEEYATTPRDAVQDADIIFMCLGNDDDVRSVYYGDDGVLQALKRDAILVDHTTSSADLAGELAKACAEKNAHFLDAPVSGGQAGAENGALTIMVGGDEVIFERARASMAHYGKTINLMGGTGSGQLAKMVNQICIAGVLQGLSEGINFAIREGLDIDVLTETLKGGAAQSWQMVNRAQSMGQEKFDFGFALDWMIKDLGYCLERAQKNGSSMALTQQVFEFYGELSAQGHGRLDTSALIKRLK